MLARAEEMRIDARVRILEIGAILRCELLGVGVCLSCCAEVLVLCCLGQASRASLYPFDQSLHSVKSVIMSYHAKYH